jgi:hypothetical protein
LSGRKIVPANDLAAGRQEMIDKIATDKSCSSGHKYFVHGKSFVGRGGLTPAEITAQEQDRKWKEQIPIFFEITPVQAFNSLQVAREGKPRRPQLP